MADAQVQMSRVQRELLELKQRGQVKSQADKLRDCKLRSSFVLSGSRIVFINEHTLSRQ
jgi:hypothetical protein